MYIKDALKNSLQSHLGEIASPLFLNRALGVIEQAGHDREGLLEASVKVSRMTALFIDTDLADRILSQLKMKIEKAA